MHLFPVLFLKLLSPSLTESAVAVFFFFSGCPNFRFEVVNEENQTGRKTKPKNQKREEKSRCIQISKDIVLLARGKNVLPVGFMESRLGPETKGAGVGASSWLVWPGLYPTESPTTVLQEVGTRPSPLCSHTFSLRGDDAEAVCSPGISGAKEGTVSCWALGPGRPPANPPLLGTPAAIQPHPSLPSSRRSDLPSSPRGLVFSRKGQYTALIHILIRAHIHMP